MICFSKNLLLLKRWLSPRQNIDREIKVREGKAKFALWLNGTDGTPPPFASTGEFAGQSGLRGGGVR